MMTLTAGWDFQFIKVLLVGNEERVYFSQETLDSNVGTWGRRDVGTLSYCLVQQMINNREVGT